jgi:hypothetical protein
MQLAMAFHVFMLRHFGIKGGRLESTGTEEKDYESNRLRNFSLQMLGCDL